MSPPHAFSAASRGAGPARLDGLRTAIAPFAASAGWHAIRKHKIAAFIEQERQARKKRLRMDADEALENITRIARTDPRRFFKDGRLLPIEQWPDEVARSVKILKRLPDGGFTLALYDQLKANELMAIAGGELKPKGGPMQEEWSVNWTAPFASGKRPSFQECWEPIWRRACDGPISWDARRKLEQTDRFLHDETRWLPNWGLTPDDATHP